MTEFAMRARAIVDDMLMHAPIVATFAGIHDYDGDVPDLTVDGFAERQTRAKQHLATLAPFTAQSLVPDERIDAELLRARFDVELRELAELQLFKRDPSLYADVAVEGLYALLVRPYGAPADRIAVMQSRMSKIPHIIAAAKANLERSPLVWVETAIDITSGGIDFLSDAFESYAQQSAPLRAALASAVTALLDYREFLQSDRLPRSTGGFEIGRDLFDYKLKREHMLPYDAGSLLEFGEEMVRSTQASLESVARRIDGQKHWVELIDGFRRDHPQPKTLLDYYRRGLEDIKRFVIERGLVSFPDGEHLEVVETPIFMRPLLPYAAYQAPAAFDERQDGLYYVTPVDAQGSPEAVRDQLLGHNRFGVILTNVHEGYPGHHLQLVRANRHPSAVRRLLGDSSVFCEGWALYCEQMVLDEGLSDDPRVRLFQLKDQLWRACRVVVDVKLHTGRFTFPEAVDFMVDVAHLEKFNAVGEVRRYTQSATQPMSYLVGKQQILDLRERERRRLGNKFDLRGFHDRLLSCGTIPLALIEPAFAA